MGSTDCQLGAGAARSRILRATVACVRESGVANTTLQSVAREAGVSKALVLYHFGRKDNLLASTLEWLLHKCALREQDALRESDPARVLEDLWAWVADEISRGDMIAAFEIGRQGGPAVAAITAKASHERLQNAERTVGEVFSKLPLEPRVPIALLGTAQLAFVDGLAMQAIQRPGANHRIAFDVFWLAMLNLVE